MPSAMSFRGLVIGDRFLGLLSTMCLRFRCDVSCLFEVAPGIFRDSWRRPSVEVLIDDCRYQAKSATFKVIANFTIEFVHVGHQRSKKTCLFFDAMMCRRREGVCVHVDSEHRFYVDVDRPVYVPADASDSND